MKHVEFVHNYIQIAELRLSENVHLLLELHNKLLKTLNHCVRHSSVGLWPLRVFIAHGTCTTYIKKCW